MSVKALQKQLIAAVAMVVVAAIAVSSSTFAWFAANASVQASGMNVTAKSDTVFLQIKGTGGTAAEGTIAGNGGDFSTTGAVSMANVKLFPTAYENFSNPRDLDDLDDNTKWYYGYSDASNVATLNATTKTTVPSTDYGKYIAKVTYQVKLAEDSGTDTAYDLYVKAITLPENTGIYAIVAGADDYATFTATQAEIAAPGGTTRALSNTVTKTAQTITVYLYFDGNDEHVYTDNIAQLTGAVTMKLGCCTVDTIGA